MHILVWVVVSLNVFGQIEITDGGSNPSVASDCISALQFQVVQVSSSMSCKDPLEILYDQTGPISGLGSTIASFSGTYNLQFDSVGIYSFFCGSKAIADQCFSVLPPPTTPTIGEWGLIVLGLSLCIIGLLFIRQENMSSLD